MGKGGREGTTHGGDTKEEVCERGFEGMGEEKVGERGAWKEGRMEEWTKEENGR